MIGIRVGVRDRVRGKGRVTLSSAPKAEALLVAAVRAEARPVAALAFATAMVATTRMLCKARRNTCE